MKNSAVFASLSMLLSAAAAPADAENRPNVVLVTTDDQGYGDVGVHGNRMIATPHLDRFAQQGVQFTRFYCSPVCAPTRASLTTGRYYYHTGVIHTSRGGAKMHGDEVTLAERLASAGYRTGIFGKWHLGDNYPMRPQDQGFEETLVHKSGGIDQSPDKPNSYFDPVLWKNGRRLKTKGYCTDVFFTAAMEFVERAGDKPFFVYLPTNAPHTPLQVPEKYSEPYRKRGLNDATAKVYAMVQNIDENFGRLLAKLDERKLLDKTIVVFLSDNGPQQRRFNAGLRGRKGTTYEGGIRVPCFVQWPGRWKGGRKIDRIAAHIDIAPTILDACGVKPPGKPEFDGVSLAPLLRGRAGNHPERALYFQCHRGLSPTPFRNCAVVTQRYKLVGNFGTFSKAPPVGREPVLELYDLKNDPGESKDVFAANPDVGGKLADEYRAWFADVKATRNFRPGTIHVGSSKENPTLLCRYQDGTYRDGASIGWQATVERTGWYRVRLRRGKLKGPGFLHCRWKKGAEVKEPLNAGEDTMKIQLERGTGLLDVWFADAGGNRVVVRDNGVSGDVELRYLSDGRSK